MILTGGNSSMDINQNKLIMYHYYLNIEGMKKIKSFYYEIVIANIYLLDINKREYDESSVYDGIWVTLQTFVVYTVISFIFILIRIFGTLQNPLATGIGVVILCQIAVHLIMKKLKKSSYVQIVHEEYLISATLLYKNNLKQ